MKTNLIFALVCLFGASALAEGEWSCFQNGALKDNFILRFQTEGAKVSGTYTIERGYGMDGTEEHEFTGTKAGSVLSVTFAKTLPEEDGVKVSRLEITIRQAGDEQALKAKAFSAQKKLLSTAQFEACEAGFTKVSNGAERIHFSATTTKIDRAVTFERQNQRFAFLVKMQKGQALAVHAPGAGISYFDPAKKRYEEGTAIDDLSVENAKAGDYLIVLSPAGEPQRCPVTFTLSGAAISR